jgi:hydrogenase maturation factor
MPRKADKIEHRFLTGKTGDEIISVLMHKEGIKFKADLMRKVIAYYAEEVHNIHWRDELIPLASTKPKETQ